MTDQVVVDRTPDALHYRRFFPCMPGGRAMALNPQKTGGASMFLNCLGDQLAQMQLDGVAIGGQKCNSIGNSDPAQLPGDCQHLFLQRVQLFHYLFASISSRKWRRGTPQNTKRISRRISLLFLTHLCYFQIMHIICKIFIYICSYLHKIS